MKVLMFGWEFPPHISGGLGTACAGLTRALEKTEIEVLFAIPKLWGGESADRTSFINASAVPIRQRRSVILKGGPATSPEKSDLKYHFSTEKNSTRSTKGRQTIFEIPSLLTPYQPPSETHKEFSLKSWNYSFDRPNDRTIPAGLRSEKQANIDAPSTTRTSYVKEPYHFSGTYGEDLFEEVEKYALAGVEIARRNKFDVIHAHDWMTFPAGIAAKKVTGKPLIVHVHATEIDRSGAHVNSKVFAIEREGMHQADKVVTVSNWTKDIAIKHYQVDENRIEVVHNGITPRTNLISTSAGPLLGCPIITFLGRITHQKGPMYFVEAARKVHEKFPEAHFVVAGSGDQLPKMVERIAQVRLAGYFHFTGFLRGDDVDRIWAVSNVYVMPSVSEPFGIAPLEAIQAGVPVILSKQAGVTEVMPHAIKVDFWNSGALAEAICSLLRFKSLANTLKKNGAEQVKNITWDKAAEKLTTLYYELSSKHEKAKKSDLLLSGTSTQKTTESAVP